MSNQCATFIDGGRCSYCGAEVEDTHKFCHGCGKRLHPIERKHEQEAAKERHYDVYRRWLDGPTYKQIAAEFEMHPSNVSNIVRFVIGKMRFDQLPSDIGERVASMLGHGLGERDKPSTYYEQLKVIRKL